jgi:hypothetical protein
MAHRIKTGLNPRNKGTELNPKGLAYNGSRARFLGSTITNSWDPTTRADILQVKAQPMHAMLEVALLERMQILR